MQKSFITATPDSGSGNGTVTCSASQNNTELLRRTSITVSGGGITRTVSISQAAGYNPFLLNIAPTAPTATYPAEEVPDAFSTTIYEMDAEGTVGDTVAVSTVLSLVKRGYIPDIQINWSPLGGKNVCAYTQQTVQNDNAIWNPNVSNGTLRWVLDFDEELADSTNRYSYFDLRHAAFHQGSPIIEIVMTYNGEFYIYTLAQLHQGTENYRYIRAQTTIHQNSAQVQYNTEEISQNSLNKNMAGLVWSTNALLTWQQTGRALFSTTGYNIVNQGLDRIFIPLDCQQLSVLKPRIVKWWMEDRNKIVTYIMNATDLRFTPKATSPAYYQCCKVTWTGNNETPQQAHGSYLVSAIYNP